MESFKQVSFDAGHIPIGIGDIRTLNSPDVEISKRCVVVFSGPTEINGCKVYRVCPVSSSLHLAGNDDITVTDEKFLGEGFLIETWNEFPLEESTLGDFLGNLLPLIQSASINSLIELRDDQRQFRQVEIITFRHLSNSLFRNLDSERLPSSLMMRVAAGLAIIICSFLVYLSSRTSGDDLFNKYYRTPTLAFDPENINDYEQVRGESCIFSNLNSQECEIATSALVNYSNGNFERTAIELKSILSTTLKNPFLSFHLAISYIETGQFENAVSILSELDGLQSFEMESQVDYFLAIVFLKTERKEQAKKKLKELSKSKNDYSQKARNLIDEMPWF